MMDNIFISKLTEFFFPGKVRFRAHYEHWRNKRVACIIDHYGKNFFKNKTILELGCGYGDIGALFAKLGADVTCSDAREEHLNVLKKRYPYLKVVKADLDENKWPFRNNFDLILHLGTLYHLTNIEQNLKRTCKATKHIVLESEVCDSNDPEKIIMVKEWHGYDQAYNKRGNRPSPAYIEKIFKKSGMKFKQLNIKKYNTSDHQYDWKVKNTGRWRHGLRRMWFVEKI